MCRVILWPVVATSKVPPINRPRICYKMPTLCGRNSISKRVRFITWHDIIMIKIRFFFLSWVVELLAGKMFNYKKKMTRHTDGIILLLLITNVRISVGGGGGSVAVAAAATTVKLAAAYVVHIMSRPYNI